MNGIIIIDKPPGPTSNDICQKLKRILRCKKVGHTGTLDPLASGVLPILINGATKWAPRFAADDKEYIVTARFGISTTTYDCEGEVTSTLDVPADLASRIESALPRFRGAILQTPPPYSAVKYKGKPLYWWARKGRQVEVPPRPVVIRDMVLYPMMSRCHSERSEESSKHSEVLRLSAQDDTIRIFRIVCSKGTYIRSLIHDLGQAVGCGAHVAALRRTRSGNFTIEKAIPLTKVMEPVAQIMNLPEMSF